MGAGTSLSHFLGTIGGLGAVAGAHASSSARKMPPLVGSYQRSRSVRQEELPGLDMSLSFTALEAWVEAENKAIGLC